MPGTVIVDKTELDELRAIAWKNERLRAALEKIANTEGNIHPSWHVQTAREALGNAALT